MLTVIAFHEPLDPWQRVIFSCPEDAPELFDTANTKTTTDVIEKTRA